MSNSDKKLRAIRVNESLQISFREIEEDALSSVSGKNISEAGLCIPLTERPVSPFMELTIHSGEFKAPMTATARIVWVKESGVPGFPFEAGLEFLILGPAERDVLHRYITRSAERGPAPEIRWIDAP